MSDVLLLEPEKKKSATSKKKPELSDNKSGEMSQPEEERKGKPVQKSCSGINLKKVQVSEEKKSVSPKGKNGNRSNEIE